MFDATVAPVTVLGPAVVTIERVATRSGVACSTIYRRWPDVNRLFVEAFKALTRLAPTPLTGRLDDDLATFGHQYARRLDDPIFFSVVIFLLDEWRDSKRYRSLARSITGSASAAPPRSCGRPSRRGELRPDVDPWRSRTRSWRRCSTDVSVATSSRPPWTSTRSSRGP